MTLTKGHIWIIVLIINLISHFCLCRDSIASVEYLAHNKIPSTGLIRSMVFTDGRLYMGAENGFFVRTGSVAKVFDETNSELGASYVSALYKDNNNVIWIVEYGAGLYSYDLNHPDPKKLALPRHIERNLWGVVGYESTLFILLTNGVAIYNLESGTIKEVSTVANEQLKDLRHIAIFQGEVWFASQSHLFSMSTSGDIKSVYDSNYKINLLGDFTAISAITNSLLVVGKYGIAEINKDGVVEVITRFKNETLISSIYEDKQKNLWFGGDDRIYLKADKSNKIEDVTFKFPEIYTSGEVSSIVETHNGELAFATSNNGLVSSVLDKNLISRVRADTGYLSEKITTVLAFNEAEALIKTQTGFFTIDKKTGLTSRFRHKALSQNLKYIHLSGNSFYMLSTCSTLHFERNKEINVSNTNPECKFNTGSDLTRVDTTLPLNDKTSNLDSLTKALPSNVTRVLQNKNGLLVALDTSNRIYTKIDASIWSLSVLDELKGQYVNCVFLTDEDKLYFCVPGLGLVYSGVSPNNLQWHPLKTMDTPRFIRSGIQDFDGTILIGSNKGLWLIDSEHTRHKLEVTEGIFDYDFEYDSIFSLGNQKYIVVGDNYNYLVNLPSLNRLISGRELRKSKSALLSLTGRIDNELKVFAASEFNDFPLLIAHDTQELTFTISSSDFNYSHKHNLEYRLKGVNDNWIEIQDHVGSVSFAKLPYGKYVFESRVVNPFSNASQPITQIPFVIETPFWWSWQARLCYVGVGILLMTGLFYLFQWMVRRRNYYLSKLVGEQQEKLHESHQSIKKLLEKKQQLFTNLSHEIRTPLTLMLAPLEQLRETMKEPNKSKQLDAVLKNANRMGYLVEQLLEVEQLDLARELPKQRYNVKADISLVVESLRPLATEKQQVVHLLCETSSSLQIELLQDTLEKVLSNLLSNAIKYTPSGGRIKIKVFEQDSALFIRISDSGEGISSNQQEVIFERFSRASDDNNGYGVGLALVKELVNANDGWIKLSSEIGKGAEFTVSLPIHPTSVDNTRVLEKVCIESVSEDTDVKDKRPVVLICDDNDDMRVFLFDLLKSKYLCFTASNGDEAYQTAIAIKPDIIITDLMMPVRDGLALSEQLREHELFARVPILLLTAKGDAATKIKSFHTGINQVMSKPFNHTELLLCVANLLAATSPIKPETIATKAVPLPGADMLSLLPFTPVVTNEKQQRFLLRVLDVIAQHFSENEFNRTAAAGLLAMSERQLNRRLAELGNENFSEYLKQFRVARGQSLLEQGHTITTVAYEVGFTSPSYFSSCFKKRYQVTPSEYIENLNSSSLEKA